MFSTLAIALLALLAIPPVAAQIGKGRNITITGSSWGYTIKDAEASATLKLTIKQKKAIETFGLIRWGPIVTNTVTTPGSWFTPGTYFSGTYSTTTLTCKSLD